MFPNPPFVIAFVTIRFLFSFSQSYSKFRIVKPSSLKVFPRISLRFSNLSGKAVEQRNRAELSRRVVAQSFSCREFAEPVKPKSQNCRGKDSALSNLRFSQEKISMNEKCRNILFVCRLPWFFKLNGNGWRYSKCGIRMFCLFMPTQM